MNIKGWIKGWIKSRFYGWLMKDQLSPAVGIQQRHLYHYYRSCIASGQLPEIRETGFKVFSQFEEDGMLLFVLAVIGMKTKRFIEIGADDGVNSNSANLYFHFGYQGLFIDGNPRSIRRGERFFSRHPNPWYYPPRFCNSRVTCENVNALIQEQGFSGEVDLLSIDIDGNDYWIWEAMEVCSPRVVIIETHVEFGLRNIVVPYDPDYSFPGIHPVYHGASGEAMMRLGRRKGYRLVGANHYGSNFIFVREELCGDLLPECDSASLLQHPSARESFQLFEQVQHLPYLEGK